MVNAIYLYSLFMLFITILKGIWWKFELRIYEHIDRDDIKQESTVGLICLGMIQCLLIIINIAIMVYVNPLAFIPVVTSLAAYILCDLPYLIRMHNNEDFNGDYRKLTFIKNGQYFLASILMISVAFGLVYIAQNNFVIFRILLFLVYMNQIPKILKSFITRTRPRWSYHSALLHITNYLPLLYFFGCPYNILNVISDYKMYTGLAIMIIVQIFITSLQRQFGGGVCLGPERASLIVTRKRLYRIESSDIKKVNQDSMFMLDFKQAQILQMTVESQDYDCSICLQIIFTIIKDTSQMQWKKDDYIMLTKCKHFYHSDCLEVWLGQRQQCPNCRTYLHL